MTQELVNLRTSILEGRYPEALAIVDEWYNLIESEIIDDAIADASEEVLNGAYSQFQLSELLNRTNIIDNAVTLLNLTYSNTAKELPTAIANILIQLPGGQEWIERQK